MSVDNAVEIVCETGNVFRIHAEWTVEYTLQKIEASYPKRGCQLLDGSGKVPDPGQSLGSLKTPIMLTGGARLTQWQGNFPLFFTLNLTPFILQFASFNFKPYSRGWSLTSKKPFLYTQLSVQKFEKKLKKH